MYIYHDSFANFLGVGHYLLLGIYNCFVLHSFLDLHSIGVLSVVQHHIAAVWPESLSAAAVVEMMSADVCPVLRFPHAIVVHAQSQEFQSRIFISAILSIFLSPHHTTRSRGSFPHTAWGDLPTPLFHSALFKK